MLEYLICLIDADAPSFCYYPRNNAQARMSEENLRKVVQFSLIHNLRLSVLKNNTPLPESYLKILDDITHIYISPAGQETSPQDISLFESAENALLNESRVNDNVICLVNKSELPLLPQLVRKLCQLCIRLNVHLLDIDQYNTSDFDLYQSILEEIEPFFEKNFNFSQFELNILSDRIILRNMKNCNAGISHLTVAPNGKLYICPGFYFSDPQDALSDISKPLNIKNQQLYNIEYAPICRNCDCWQCKRCIWLNRRTTHEVNTPSHEQCVVSHLERNASRNILLSLLNGNSQQTNAIIPELNYLDPFSEVSRDHSDFEWVKRLKIN